MTEHIIIVYMWTLNYGVEFALVLMESHMKRELPAYLVIVMYVTVVKVKLARYLGSLGIAITLLKFLFIK
jgi:hypothetical protein